MKKTVAISSAILLIAMVFVPIAHGEGYAGKRELLDKRTLTSKTFDNEDGSYTAVISTEPVHYLDKDNAWQDIDTRIRPLHGAPPTGYDYAADANLIRIFFSKGKKESGTRSGVTFQTDVESFHFVPFEKAAERDGSILVSERIRHTPEQTSVEGSEIRFHGQFGEDGDVAYEVRRGALIQKIYLPQMPDLAMEYDGEDDFLVYRFFFGKSMRAGDRRKLPLYVDGRLMEEDFSISKEMEFRSYYDNTILGFSGSKVYEVDGKRRSAFCPYGVHFGTSHAIFLSLRIPLSWLKDPDRTFPVVIENRLKVKGYSRTTDHTRGSAKIASISDDLNLDDYLSVYQYDGSSYDWTLEFLVGRHDSREEGRSNQKYRAWLKWNTSSIPDGSDVTSATFDLDCTFFESADTVKIKANNMENEPYWGQDEQTAWEDCGDGTTYQTFTVNNSAWSGSFDNDSDFNAAIENHLSDDWIAVGFKSESEGTNPSWAEFYTGVPLTVVYTPITVSNVQITDLTDNTVTVSWNTDKPSWTIFYWTSDPPYYASMHYETPKTSHSVTRTDLSASTYYLFKIGTKAEAGAPLDDNAYSGNFTTLASGRYVPVEYSTIQSAINAASSDETVYVTADTLNEHDISMKTGVDLKKSSGTVTIEADYPYKVAIFNGVSNITVEGIIFSGDHNNPAVQVLNCGSGIEFTDCEFLLRQSGSGHGLYLSGGSSSVSGQECSFHGCNYGLYVINASPTFDNKNRFYANSIGVMCLNQGLPDLSPNNNFSYTSVNSSYDIYAYSNVTGDIDATSCYWGDGERDPVVHHDGSGSIDTSNPRATPAKIVVDTRPLARAQEKLRRGDRVGALADFKAIIASPASQEEALAAVHGVMFASNETPEEVEAALSYLEGVQKDHRGSELEAAALYVSISGLASRGRPDEALSNIERILRDHPSSRYVPYALLEKAFLLKYSDKDKQGAEETFAQIAAAYPDWILTPMVEKELEAIKARGRLLEVVQKEEKSAVSLRSYPNPFNPQTTLSFALPEAMWVRLVVYNLLGQEVRVLADGVQQAGTHTVLWDGRDMQGGAGGSGLYFARLEAGGQIHPRKLLLVR